MIGRILSVFLVVLALWVFLGEFTVDPVFVFGVFSFWAVSGFIVDVALGRRDFFDPAFLFSLWVLFYLLVSPVSQLQWDYWPFLPSMTDDIEWVYLWSFLNFLGVLVFLFFVKYSYGSISKRNYFYTFNEKKLITIGGASLFICLVVQLYIYQGFGGVYGFVQAFSERQSLGVDEYNPFEGYGMLMLVSESFKIIFPMVVIGLFRRNQAFRLQKGFWLFMVACFIMALFFGGLRGSRSSTLFSLFFAAGMYHFYVRRLERSTLLVGVLAATLFLSGYYWYKVAGVDGLSGEVELHSDREDVVKYLVARDLGRMDIQSLTVKRYLDDGYEYSFGRTYLVSIFSSIPKQLIPYSPDQITKEKTDILYGEGWYSPSSSRQTTLVLGQVGEAFVNFGLIGIFAFFAVLGVFTGRIQAMMYGSTKDVVMIMVPFLTLSMMLLLITDMNVVIYQLVRYMLLPGVVFLLCLRREPVCE